MNSDESGNEFLRLKGTQPTRYCRWTAILAVLVLLFVCSGESIGAPAGSLGFSRGSATRAGTAKPLVGIWYFDGWADTSTSNAHLNGKSSVLNPAWSAREPLTGWYDNDRKTIETFSDWGCQAGLGFWAFEWFPGDSSENTALANYLASPSASKNMQFAVGYINGTRSDAVTPANWQDWCHHLTKTYFIHPAYVRANGKPIFFIYNPTKLASRFGGADGFARAMTTLRNEAKAASLELEIVSLGGTPSRQEAAVGITSFSYYSILPGRYDGKLGTVAAPAANSYSLLVSAGKARWAQMESVAEKYGAKYIPVVTTG